MKKFFSFIIRQSVAVVLVVIFVLAFGVYATMQMPINLLPDINVPMVCVQVIYPGANASSVEEDVTVNLEEGLSAIGGVTSVDSYSYDNLSAVVLSFEYGTDTDGKKSEIQSKLSSIELPDGVSTTVYDIDLNSEALATLSVTSEKSAKYDESERAQENLELAYTAAQELSSKLQAIDGVESVEIKGGAENYYLVQPFGGLELIVPLLVEAFSYGALDLPLGNITEEGESVQIRNDSDIADEEDIRAMPLTLPQSLCTLFAAVKAGLVENIEPMLQLVNPAYSLSNPVVVDYILNSEEYKAMIYRGLAQNPLTAGLAFSDELIKFILTTDFPAEGGLTVKVSDVATVSVAADYTSYVYYSDGAATLVKGAIVEVYKSNGANSAAVVERVKEVYGEYLSENAENSLAVQLLDDQSEFISDSIGNVLVSMIIGGVLAIVVIFLFLKKVRLSLVIAITMPLSVLAALICLYLMGITLNMVSLGGLAVGIGMLVDNSIVVIESISKHRDKGKTAYQAAVDGTVEVGGALLGSTLTTVCVFIPIIFTGGLTAEIFTDLAWAVIFSLAFSLIVAVTVIPALYALFGKRQGMLKGGNLAPSLDGLPPAEEGVAKSEIAPPAPEEERDEPIGKEGKTPLRERLRVLKEPRLMNGVTAGYAKILPAVLNKKLVTILTAVVVFAASVGLLFLTGMEFLPSIDKGQIEINMSYGSTSEIGAVEQDVFAFAERVRDNVQDIEYISVSVGKNGLLALTDTGIITVQLTTNRGTSKVVEQIRSLAQGENKPAGNVTVKEVDGVVASLTSGSSDMSVTVVGDDGETLKQIALDIKSKLEENGFYDVTPSSTESSAEYDLTFDRAKIAEYGLDYQTIVLTLRIGLASYTACTVTIDGQKYDVNVKFADGAVTDIQSLENFVVGFYGQTPVTLSELCKITKTTTEACIRRSNGQLMVSVAASKNTDTGTASSEMQKIAAEVLAEYEGYSFEASGISSYLTDAFEGLAVALVVSFFLLYAVMAVQFSSGIKPLIIMASIPFSFTGGFIALVITGTSLNVVSFIGLIMLMGVVVNNAIVMLEKIKQLHEEGMPHYYAVQEACKTRLRPILMTTLTTVLALIPMAIGVGQGSELMQPLGIVVIGGLLIGTLVTLVLVPAVYCAVHRLSAKKID